jgi:hypothetical protein
MPIDPIIEKIAKVARVDAGEDYEYFTIGPETKTIYTVSNCTVTQVQVTPDSENDLVFNSYISPEYWVCLEKILEAKYDAIALKTKTANEAFNRKEVKDVLDVAIASAVAQGQTFSNDSGVTSLNIVKLEEMTRALDIYGTKFVLITGSTVGADVRLMQYNADKNQAFNLSLVGIVDWINVPAFQYEHSGTQTVLAADKAILVALSDSDDRRPIHFVRRKVRATVGAENTGTKERVVVNLGPRIQVGAVPKMGMSVVVFGQYGTVAPNPYAFAVYQRAESYS